MEPEGGIGRQPEKICLGRWALKRVEEEKMERRQRGDEVQKDPLRRELPGSSSGWERARALGWDDGLAVDLQPGIHQSEAPEDDECPGS